jgi:hypothetical protein
MHGACGMICAIIGEDPLNQENRARFFKSIA